MNFYILKELDLQVNKQLKDYVYNSWKIEWSKV